jgi:glyoxylase-like metal-dependent hydrolase (beta-lactamase superfamily II)
MSKVFLCSAMLLFSTFASAADSMAVTVKMEPKKVGAHSYYVQGATGQASSANQGFMSNAGFVVTDDGVVVFDTLGTPPLADALIKAIAKITSQPIKRVIVSHYHADHIYGLQSFKALGAEIWAHKNGQQYLASEVAKQRLEQRRDDLFPWVDKNTRLLPADLWLDGDTDFEMGGLHFSLRYVGPAHSPEDMVMLVKEDGVLFAGDIVFKGRIPFVGGADSRAWLGALDKLIAMQPKHLIPGHGAASDAPRKDLQLTRDYLAYLRETMGHAVQEFIPPTFKQANRINAYNTYLLMEKESLKQ